MTFDDFAWRYGLGRVPVDEDTRFCMDWLESLGRKFGVDFGYNNAKEVAQQVALERIANRRMDGR